MFDTQRVASASDRPTADLPSAVTSAAALTERQSHLVPTAPALRPLFPDGGLRRGSTVSITGTAATSLSLALLAESQAAGGWCAAVGLDSLGLLAADQAGVALSRFAVVSEQGADWPVIVATLLDAFEVILLRPPSRVSARLHQRLAARVRERQRVLVLLAADGTAGLSCDVALIGTASVWEGLGWGTGHLRSRQVEVRAEGRRLAGRPRRTALWLPDPDGRVTPVRPASAPTPLRAEGVA